jgi:hypothetical protein
MMGMSEVGEANSITVHVKYGDIEQTFTGNVNDVWVSVNRFFSDMIPELSITHGITLTLDLAKVVEDFKGVVAIAPEGPELIIPKEKLTDSETLQLYLLAAYLGYKLGKLTRETMTKEELQAKLGKTPKTTSARLSELVKQGNLVKTEEGTYKIATIAIKKLQDALTKSKLKVG